MGYCDHYSAYRQVQPLSSCFFLLSFFVLLSSLFFLLSLLYAFSFVCRKFFSTHYTNPRISFLLSIWALLYGWVGIIPVSNALCNHLKSSPLPPSRFWKCLTLVRLFFRILNSDIIQFGRYSDVVRGVISVRSFIKYPAYPFYVTLSIG